MKIQKLGIIFSQHITVPLNFCKKYCFNLMMGKATCKFQNRNGVKVLKLSQPINVG